jgi:hypothetical protein
MDTELRSFIVIEPFMLDYKLPQTELLCYAIIHSFSKQQQGCFYGTQTYLAEQIRVSKQSVNQALASLETRGLIVKTATLKRFEYSSVIVNCGLPKSTTVDHEVSQPQLTDSQPQLTDQSTTVDRIPYNNKSDNKINIKNNKTAREDALSDLIFGYTENLVLRDTLSEFIKMRILIKKKPTNHALELIFAELDKLAKTDEEKVKILNQSIMNCWQGVFQLKEQGSGKTGSFTEKKAEKSHVHHVDEDGRKYDRFGLELL